MLYPDLKFENALWQQGHSVIGIDEVGRGAFAGPVGIGGVVFPSKMKSDEKENLLSLGINDSKKLSPKKREYLSLKIKELADCYHISLIPVATINEIGIGKATYLGMQEVAEKITEKMTAAKPFLLIDAFEIPGSKFPQKGIVRGDTLSISIAAASIIAKVERDALMDELGKEIPRYGFERHKGYGTRLHRDTIMEFGACEHHRTDFVSNYI